MGEEAGDAQGFGYVEAAEGLGVVDDNIRPSGRLPFLIQDPPVHRRGPSQGVEIALAGESRLAFGRLQTFERPHVQGGEAQAVAGDESLEALAGRDGHLVARLHEPGDQSHERLHVSAAAYGEDRDVH